jgi:polar amino acid transport system permease protein
MNYDWNFARLLPYADAFFYGTLTTLALTAYVIVIGTVVGVLLGLGLRSRRFALFAYPVIDVVRAVPPLVLILFMYYLLTIDVIGTAIPAYWVYVVAMSLNLAAFTADFVRAAIGTIGNKIIESGKALGMSDPQVARHIYIPHLFRSLIPAMTALYIGMLKMSSLASVINVAELVYAAQTVSVEIARSLEAWVVVGAIYVIIVLPAAYALRYAERMFRKEMPPGVNL